MKRLALGTACIAALLTAFAIAQPASAATSATAAIPNCPKTITNADHGSTVMLKWRSCATLSLDPDYVWTTPKSSSSAVEVFDTETVAPDQQWGLRARHGGFATITSTGVPDCDPGEICPLVIRTFSVRIFIPRS